MPRPDRPLQNRGNAAGAIVIALALAGCSPDDPAPDDAADRAATRDSAAAADSIFLPRADTGLPPERIYYRLTDYPWYAEGRPLLHEGREYQPAGTPVTATLEEMSPAGEYEGVEYYVRSGESAEELYVPVYEGYWQAFRPEGGE